ncbi:hypothetical protein QBA54_32180 [Streptomyces sp. B21-108]|uniref:hypothetical protein n=1 Tax=Streptomyces sp. B21-108 TaxID=3039419 RepID=UPI002FF17D33
MQKQHENPEALRDFLKLCLNPPYGDKRTPVRLAEVLPTPVYQAVIEHAPHLAELRIIARELAKQAEAAHTVYADALAAWIHGEEPQPDEPKPTPAPRRSMPLLEAVKVAYDAAVSHATKCRKCWPGMRFAEMCPDGQREVVAFLDNIGPETECTHIAWEVTSEYRNAQGRWVKSRKCADCGDPMDSSVEPEPHWPKKAARHSARG